MDNTYVVSRKRERRRWFWYLCLQGNQETQDVHLVQDVQESPFPLGYQGFHSARQSLHKTNSHNVILLQCPVHHDIRGVDGSLSPGNPPSPGSPGSPFLPSIPLNPGSPVSPVCPNKPFWPVKEEHTSHTSLSWW